MTPSELETRIRELWDFDDPDASASLPARRPTRHRATRQAIWLTPGRACARPGGAIRRRARGARLPRRDRAWVCTRRPGSRSSAAGCSTPPAPPPRPQQDFGTAYSLASRAGLDGLAVDALHMTAIVVGQINGPEAAAATTLAALELAEASADPERHPVGPVAAEQPRLDPARSRRLRGAPGLLRAGARGAPGPGVVCNRGAGRRVVRSPGPCAPSVASRRRWRSSCGWRASPPVPRTATSPRRSPPA